MNRAVLAGLMLGGCALGAALGDTYAARLGTNLMMYVVLAASWNIAGGFVGYPSFATAAFFGLGAYASAILQARGVPIAAAWLAGAVTAACFAALLGGLILQLRGHYFAVASLISVEVLRETVNAADDLTAGGMGLNLPPMAFDALWQGRFFLASMTALAGLTLAIVAWAERAKLGFAWRCIRQNETAASAIGIDAARAKTAALVLSSAFPGAAGAIYGNWIGYIDPSDTFDVLLSVKPIVMALLGGAGTLAGPIVGAIGFLGMEEFVWRNFLQVHEGLLGAAIVALLLFLPHGMLGGLGHGRWQVPRLRKPRSRVQKPVP